MMETYYGYVRTPADAIKLFEACRLGQLPRVQRRLSEKERQSIRSGSVFVWDEREAGMRRWTDGKSWSASRVSGSFLTYREMEGKRGSGFGSGRRGAGKTPDSGRGSDEDQDDGEPDGYRYKADGLMKQSFSITTSQGQHLHLISYYSRPQPGQPELLQPSNDPSLRHIVPLKGMYPESSMNEAPVPALTRAPMQQQPYMPPQHPEHPSQPYPTQYVQQPAYSFPPSPVATPPYSHGHYTVAPAYPPAQLPPPHAYQPGQQHPPYHSAPAPHPPPPPHHYERAPLPPPPPQQQQQPSMPLPQPYPHPAHTSPHLSQPRAPPAHSPQSQHLQAQAREAVLIDPRLSINNAQNGPVPLPPVSHSSQHVAPAINSPPRTHSVSPPRSSHSDVAGIGGPNPSNKASLSALLLHPTPSSSEPNSANPGSNSAGSSPKASTGGINLGGPVSVVANQPKRSIFTPTEDARAIGVLDKKFCI